MIDYLKQMSQWQQWTVGIGTSLVAAVIVWICTKVVSKPGQRSEGVAQNASPVITQQFQPVINIHTSPQVPPPQTAEKALLTPAVADQQSLRATPVSSMLPHETEIRPLANRPMIVAVRYGSRPSDNRCGLFIVNDWDIAYDVSIGNVPFGTSKLVFHNADIPRLSKADGEQLCET